MPPLSQKNSARKTLNQLRLVIAESTFRNKTNPLLIEGDMQSFSHIAELCDAYALQILINWLATRYGFPKYAEHIPKTDSCEPSLMETWPALSEEYPFNSSPPQQLPPPLLRKAFALLESACVADLHLIGTLYEQIVETPLKIRISGELHIERNTDRRTTGLFYTPPSVVALCLDLAFSPDSSAFMRAIKAACEATTDEWREARDQFKMLDPACGTGNFLVGAIRCLESVEPSQAAKHKFIRDCLFGMDVDPRAVSLCRLSLVLCLSDRFSEIRHTLGLEKAARELTLLLDALRLHVVAGDAMAAGSTLLPVGKSKYANQDPPPGADAGISTAGSFPTRFDLVATNPPYVSFGSRDQCAISEPLARYLKTSYPHSSEYKIRLHSIFQELALRYATRGGRVCLLVPDAFLTGRYYEKLRQHIVRQARVLSLTELPDDIIEGATVGNWCIAVYQRQAPAPSDSYHVDLRVLGRPPEAKRQGPAGNGGGACALIEAQHYLMPFSILVAPDRSRFRLLFSDIDCAIWSRLDGLPPLGTYLRGRTGIRSRVGQAAVVGRQPEGPSWRRGICSGSQVVRHLVRWDGIWLNVDPQLLFAGGFNPSVIEQPKLLVRQTGDRLVASYDDEGLYHLNNVHSFSPFGAANPVSGEEDLRYLDGLLNSTFWAYLYQAKTREFGRALAQIDIETVEALPAPEQSRDSCRLVANLVRWAASLARPMRDNVNNSQSGVVAVGIDRAIDRLIYDQYQLSTDEVDHIEAFTRQRGIASAPLPDRQAARRLAESVEALEAQDQLSLLSTLTLASCH